MPKPRPIHARRAGYTCGHQPRLVKLDFPQHPVVLCAACAIKTSEALNAWRRSIGDPLAPAVPNFEEASARLDGARSQTPEPYDRHIHGAEVPFFADEPDPNSDVPAVFEQYLPQESRERLGRRVSELEARNGNA